MSSVPLRKEGVSPRGERKSVQVLGVRFDAVTMEELVAGIDDLVSNGPAEIAFANPEFVLEAQRQPMLAEYLNGCEYCLADGIGIVWAAKRLQKGSLPERVTGTDFLPELTALSASREYRLFFLGGEPGVADAAAATLRSRHPKARIVGTQHGFFDSDAEVIEKINSARADIVVVCLGNPRQEEWITRHRARLTAPLVFGNGGAFDYYAGKVKRAPVFVQKLNLEWLWRLLQDPTLHRFRRQFRLWRFIYLVERERRLSGRD